MAQGVGWTASSLAGMPAPPSARITLGWLIRTGLCLSFMLAFLQYEGSSVLGGVLSLVLLGCSGVLVLCGRQRTNRLQHILGGGGLLFAALLFGEVVSYTSHDFYSVLYGLVFIGVFLSARMILQEIGVPNVIRAYSQAAILTICLSLITGRHTLFATSGRFTAGTRAHPNLISFMFAGFLPVIIWRAMEEKTVWKKRALVALSFASFGLIFLTGSRGSLVAVLAAGPALLARGATKGWLQRFRIRHLHIILLLILVPLPVTFLLQHNRIGQIGSYLLDFLSLTSTQRGVKSGLSGRTGIWQIAFQILRTHNRWLFGFGYRMGERLVGTIDNGYVQLLFESGLIAGGLIIGSMLRAFFLLWKASNLRENNPWTRYYAMLWCLMVVYFLNNVSTRYLFSFGSPFSICILFLMTASRRELVGDGIAARLPQKVKPPPRTAASDWPPTGLETGLPH
ncbi:MAG: O-antigen ligase family protein [Acidobacteriaceae bacterium]